MNGASTERTDQALAEAGRGFIWITGAKAYFLLTAAITTLAFPRLFGDTLLYGHYRIVSAVLNVVTMVVTTATIQSVAKLASEHAANVAGVRGTALRVQCAVFVPCFLLLLGFASFIANEWLADPALALPLRIASVVVIAYAGYAVLIGLLNGTRRFAQQAALDVTFATLKTILMLAAVVVTGSVAWTFGGFSAAALLILIAAFRVARLRPEDRQGRQTATAGRYLAFLVPLALYALVLNLLLQADVILLKALLGRGLSADAASRAAGLFGAAKNLALLPYQAVIALSFVVFPLVSLATSRDDVDARQRTVHGAMRLAAILSGAAVVLLAAAPDGWLGMLYGHPYTEVAGTVLPLMAGVGMLSLMHVGSAILASAGRPSWSLLGSVAGLLVQAVLLLWRVPMAQDSATAAMEASFATLAGCAVGAILTLWLLTRAFGESGWIRYVIVTVLCAATSLTATAICKDSLAWVWLPAIAIFIYGTLLTVTRTVGRPDLALARRILGRR